MLQEILCETLDAFIKADYKVHVLHTSLQWEAFVAFHPFFGEIYEFLKLQHDKIMEDMEQLGYNVPVSLAEIIKEKEKEEWEDNDDIIELTSQTTNVQEQLKLIENTLITLRDILQEGILQAGMENDYVVQNNLIDYQKQIRVYERKVRRSMGQK